MMERGILFTDTHTAEDWGMVLTNKSIPRAEVKENFVAVEGRNGDLDYTEAFGDVKYENRQLTFSFSLSNGSYLDREELINTIVQKLHGQRHTIKTDDDSTRYFSGRCKVTDITNNLAYATMKVTVNADPWYYSVSETVYSAAVPTSTQITLENNGRMTCIPKVTITGTVTLQYDGNTHALSAGSYTLADLKLPTGNKIITLSGTGTVEFKYREAIL